VASACDARDKSSLAICAVILASVAALRVEGVTILSEIVPVIVSADVATQLPIIDFAEIAPSDLSIIVYNVGSYSCPFVPTNPV